MVLANIVSVSAQPIIQLSPAPIQAMAQIALPAMLSNFHRSAYFGEMTREEWVEPGVRVLWNAPGAWDASHPTRLIVYATPNGSTAEQTLGCSVAPSSAGNASMDWHFDIQHIAAQTRRLREVTPGENIVLAVIQPDTLSWPAWHKSDAQKPALVRTVFDALTAELTGAMGTIAAPSVPSPLRVTLVGHSGGGSFLFGFLNGGDAIPPSVDRFAMLDANYNYSDAEHHGDKFLAWLDADPAHHLTVIAYDDREIAVDGKKVNGPTGGTYRASHRMIDGLNKTRPLTPTTTGDFANWTDARGQIGIHIHANPQNKILHTALIGEMNGFLEAMTEGTMQSTAWGTFGGPRAYTKWVQPAPGIPPRPADARGGAAFMASIADLAPAAREEAIAVEIGRGNIPDFLRTFKAVTVTAASDAAGQPSAKPHAATIEVMPDYLAVGSDTDFVRVPMTPMTAQRLADAFGCTLPTHKLSDDIYRAADVKLEPHPLTVAREAVATFVQFNAMIETQRAGKPLGLLVGGIKKDVVVSNLLRGKTTHNVGIYGWHKLDGIAIQPLYVKHLATYVDYSHGIRLIKRTAQIDGKPRDLHAAMHDPELCGLFSDEGVLEVPAY